MCSGLHGPSPASHATKTFCSDERALALGGGIPATPAWRPLISGVRPGQAGPPPLSQQHGDIPLTLISLGPSGGPRGEITRPQTHDTERKCWYYPSVGASERHSRVMNRFSSLILEKKKKKTWRDKGELVHQSRKSCFK